MTDITNLVIESTQCFEKAIQHGSINPVLDSLVNLKNAYSSSGFSSPKDFVETKGLKIASDFVIDRWIYQGQESLILNFRDNKAREQIADIARGVFDKKIKEINDKNRFYVDLKQYFMGIIL